MINKNGWNNLGCLRNASKVYSLPMLTLTDFGGICIALRVARARCIFSSFKDTDDDDTEDTDCGVLFKLMMIPCFWTRCFKVNEMKWFLLKVIFQKNIKFIEFWYSFARINDMYSLP